MVCLKDEGVGGLDEDEIEEFVLLYISETLGNGE